MELPLTVMVSPQLQETYSAVMEDHPRSPSVLSLEDWDMEEFDPDTWGVLVESLSEEDLSDIFKDCDALPCPAYTHEGHQLREEEQQHYDHDNIMESRDEDERVEQQELLQRQIPLVSPAVLPTECSLERELLEPLPDLDDCNSVEGSLSASTTSTCAPKSGNNIKESREEDERVEQQELLHIRLVSPAVLPTECSQKRELLEPLPHLDDCDLVEGSLSASTTSTCTAKSGEARGMVAASTVSCTTWSSASEDSDDNSVSSCPAPNDFTSGINIDQRARKEVAGTHRALDCRQPSLSTNTSSQGASQEACGHASSNLKPLAVTSGAGAPILPFTFVPPFGPIVGSNAVTSVAFSPVPNIVDLAYAANGWKRLRNADIDTGSKETGKAQDSGHSRLLSSSSIQAKGQETGPNNRVNKRAKKEERLMKNREAANRSRMKRKEILSELENRAATLSSSLVASREENDSLKQVMASLREQNSFLRGVLSAKGIAHELPPLLPISTINIRQSSGSNGGGGGRATTAVNAVVGVIGTALALVSCVAVSSMDYEGGGDSVTNPTLGSMANSRGKSGSGRRMIMSVDDYDLTSAHGHAAKEFNAGVRYVLGSEIVQLWGAVLALVVLILLLFFVAREIYNLVRRDAIGRGRRMSVMNRAFPRKPRRSGSWLTGFGVCKAQ